MQRMSTVARELGVPRSALYLRAQIGQIQTQQRGDPPSPLLLPQAEVDRLQRHLQRHGELPTPQADVEWGPVFDLEADTITASAAGSVVTVPCRRLTVDGTEYWQPARVQSHERYIVRDALLGAGWRRTEWGWTQ